MGDAEFFNKFIKVLFDRGPHRRVVVPDEVFDRLERHLPRSTRTDKGRPMLETHVGILGVLIVRATVPEYVGDVLDLTNE